jgi:hypothetical protein
MRLLRVRNLMFGLMVAAGMLAANSVQAMPGCYSCYGWGWTTEYCVETSYNEIGKTQCVDPNQGWSNCSVAGDNCTPPLPE